MFLNLVVKILISCIFLLQSIFAVNNYVYERNWSNGGLVQGIAVDSVGNVYVCDYMNHQIKKYSPTGTHLLTFGSAYLSYPGGIAIDSNDIIYANKNGSSNKHKIIKFNNSGTYLGEFGYGVINYTADIKVGSDDLIYVLENYIGTVKVFNSSGTLIREIGNGIGTGQNQIGWRSIGFGLDENDNVYVSDYDGDRVNVMTSTGTFIRAIGSSGSGNGQLNEPIGAIPDHDGSIIVMDRRNNRAQQFDTNGNFFSVIRTGLNSPWNGIVDTNNNILYFTDYGGSKIYKYVDQAADSDGDGIPNIEDDFPNDATVAVASRYPSESQYIGSLLFEDSWPYAGDYDMNDVYMGYKFETQLNNSNEVKKIKAFFTLRAAGAGFRNGFGIQFPHIELGNVENVKFYRNGELINSNFQSEVGQSKPTYIIAPSIYGDIPGDSRLVNVTDSSTFDVAVDQLPYYELEVTLINPDPYVGSAPYNPFIFVNQDRGREIHLPNHPPTDLANNAYYGTVHDQVNGEGVSRYLTSSAYGQAGLPWALDIPVEFEPPLEKTDIVEAYPNIVNWAQSATFGEIEGGGAWTVDDPELSTWYQSGNNAKRRQVNTVLRSRDQSVLSGKFGF